MDYIKHYDKLIEQAKTREPIKGYTETHHIIPKCLGGDNSIDNLVVLTAEEHYIAHLLLAKIYGGKLWFAANMMASRNNKSYAWIKKKFAKEIKKINTGRKLSEKVRLNMSLSRKGRLKSNSHKTAIGEAHKKDLEYNGEMYKGYDELIEKTGISKHLYKKYYLNGEDPIQYVGNNTYGIIERSKKTPSKASLGKKWYNNEVECKYFFPGEQPVGWKLGRLKR